MTQMPPPPSMPYQPNQPMNQPAQTNVWSIISLICGILGCFFITPLVAIVTGIVGVVQAKTLKTGRGMAIGGIILGVLWIVGGIVVVGALRYGGTAMINAIGGAAIKPQMTVTLDNLADGNTAAVQSDMPGVSQSQLDDLANQLRPMGHVKAIDFSSFDTSINNGQATYNFGGTVTFDHGTKTIDGSANTAGGKFVVDRIDIK